MIFCREFWVFIACLCCVFCSHGQCLEPEHVAVVYNADSPHGKDLAEEYMRLRGIPDGNLVALRCSDKEEISRADYERTIVSPLKRVARERKWWGFSGKKEAPFSFRNIYALVLIKGMPLKIAHQQKAGNEKASQTNTNAASVDSELALFPFDGVPIDGILANPYFNRCESIVGSKWPVVLVSRIDSPGAEACRRMIRDAVDVEKKGLWGWAVVDKGGPHAEGDKWLNEAVVLAGSGGMPLMVDSWPQTLAAGYPLMDDVAVYMGWYAWNIDGPFVDKEFRFKKGAVACHIHSFSAVTLRDGQRGWSGPLIERGAAVTVGNVNEPFLGGSHHLHLFFDRLLKGYTVAEAGGMSIPALSWQSIVLGDPLYRPFAAQNSGNIVKNDEDKYFQAWWVANREWKGDLEQKQKNLEKAAGQAGGKNFIWEALSYDAFRAGKKDLAQRYMDNALKGAKSPKDRVRMDLEKLAFSRNGSGDDPVLRSKLDFLKGKYASSPYIRVLDEWKKRVIPRASEENKGKNTKK